MKGFSLNLPIKTPEDKNITRQEGLKISMPKLALAGSPLSPTRHPLSSSPKIHVPLKPVLKKNVTVDLLASTLFEVTINQGDNEAHQVQVQVQHLTKTTDFQLLVQDEQNARYILKPVQPIMANELLVSVEQAKEYKAKAEKLSKAVSVFEQENMRLRQLVAEQQKKIDALEKEQRTQQKQIVPPINLQVDLKKTQGIDERPYSPTVLYYKK
jgi:hypothetical protein